MAQLKEKQNQRGRTVKIASLINDLSETEQDILLRQLESRNINKRKSSRKNYFNEVAYSSSKGGQTDFVRNVSEDGLFIETKIPPRLGEILSIVLPLQSINRHLKVDGEVAWRSDVGMGIKIDKIKDDAKQTLHGFLETLQS